jgi:hypothetical protein
MTHRTLLTVTTDNVKLTLDDSAVVTRLAVCSTIILLVAVMNALNLLAGLLRWRIPPKPSMTKCLQSI